MRRTHSKTGCLTCVFRKKKCDEGAPICGSCRRLKLTCVRRGEQKSAITSTNIRTLVKFPVSQGYPAFRNELEKQVSLEAPNVFANWVTELADPRFKHIPLLARLCAQSPLVREAATALMSSGVNSKITASYELSVKSYQNCIARLKQYKPREPYEQDLAMVSMLFMSFLEVSMPQCTLTLAHLRRDSVLGTE